MGLSPEINAGQDVNSYTHPGEQLKHVRESRNISTKTIAGALNLPERFILYLENGEYQLLPGSTFARGYIRNYARVLELDNGEQLVAFFDRYTGTNAIEGSHVSSLKQIKQLKGLSGLSRKFSWLIRIVGLVAIVLIVLIIWQVFIKKSPTTDIEPNTNLMNSGVEIISPDINQQAVQLPLAINAAPAEPQSVTLPLITTHSDQNAQSIVLSSSEPSQPIAQTQGLVANNTENTAESNPQVKPVSDKETSQQINVSTQNVGRVQVNASANCWVSLTDSTGKSLFNSLLAKGKSIDLKGKPPYTLVLGAPTVVKVRYEGKDVPIQPKAGTTFRMKLGK